MTIDLTELFKVQNVLKERIGYRKPDHFDKLKLSLLVEIGECANEWRGFKFWSTDQRPRKEIFVECKMCQGTGDANFEMIQEDAEGNGRHEYFDCESCEGSGSEGPKNPLLEEYVDGLHFVMELGLVIHSDFRVPFKRLSFSRDVTEKFNVVYLLTAKLEEDLLLLDDENYRMLLMEYVELADYLGFTWDQVEKAYYEKNKINHQRQAEGY